MPAQWGAHKRLWGWTVLAKSCQKAQAHAIVKKPARAIVAAGSTWTPGLVELRYEPAESRVNLKRGRSLFRSRVPIKPADVKLTNRLRRSGAFPFRTLRFFCPIPQNGSGVGGPPAFVADSYNRRRVVQANRSGGLSWSRIAIAFASPCCLLS